MWKERIRVGGTICSIHTLLQDGFLVVLELPCGFLLGCIRDCFVLAYPCPVGNIAGVLWNIRFWFSGGLNFHFLSQITSAWRCLGKMNVELRCIDLTRTSVSLSFSLSLSSLCFLPLSLQHPIWPFYMTSLGFSLASYLHYSAVELAAQGSKF